MNNNIFKFLLLSSLLLNFYCNGAKELNFAYYNESTKCYSYSHMKVNDSKKVELRNSSGEIVLPHEQIEEIFYLKYSDGTTRIALIPGKDEDRVHAEIVGLDSNGNLDYEIGSAIEYLVESLGLYIFANSDDLYVCRTGSVYFFNSRCINYLSDVLSSADNFSGLITHGNSGSIEVNYLRYLDFDFQDYTTVLNSERILTAVYAKEARMPTQEPTIKLD